MYFMEERIINRYLNLDKISRKEVNFKSKLIEWGQKNKFDVTFELLEQSLDNAQNPVFVTQVVVEHIPAGKGSGYSKKESQQEAAHETMKKIKSDPQFIDSIFAAKAEREKELEQESPIQQQETQQEFSITEEIAVEKYDDNERIITEAEEAAFMEESAIKKQ